MKLSNKIITAVAFIIVALLVITGIREDTNSDGPELGNSVGAPHAAVSPP